MTTWHSAARAADHGAGLFSDGFGWGTALLILVMVLLLAVVSGLGFLARMRERAVERQESAAHRTVDGEQSAGA